MDMIEKRLGIIIALSTLLFACSETIDNNQLKQQSIDKANSIYAKYFLEAKEFDPITPTFIGERDFNGKFIPEISDQNTEKRQAFEAKYIALIKTVDKDLLKGQDLLSYDIFLQARETDLAGFRFPFELTPIDQMNGLHLLIAQLGSGQSAQPFNNVEDYDLFLQRADGFIKWLESAQLSMQRGIEVGVVHPEIVIQKLLPQFKYHMVENVQESLFAQPIINSQLSPEELAEVKGKYLTFIGDKLIPAFTKMHDFLLNDYLPATRSEVGLSSQPDGKAWYQHMIKVYTTLDLEPKEIHELGKQEVQRILDEMNMVRETVGFTGDLPAFFEHLRTSDEYYFKSTQELVDAYDQVRVKINNATPKLFDLFPKADYKVKLTEDFRAASSAGAEYREPSADGSRQGIFYINGYNLKAQPKFLMETLSIHEASPGHHFQVSIQQELTDLPEFRRFGNYSVFSEGWALYAESLGKELGLFTDPMMWYGRLSDEQLRAMRLVVDTGLHAMGWTREQAIQYMLNNSSMNETDVIAEVERYIVMPGQALGYKIGEFKIRALRNKAEAALGKQFDIKSFHREILKDGALPLPLLEQKVNRWIKTHSMPSS